MRKVSAVVVKLRLPLLLLILVCTVLAAGMINDVAINYDLTSYLREDTDTMRAMRAMNSEFEGTSGLSLVIVGADEGAVAMAVESVQGIPGVIRAGHDAQKDVRVADGVRYSLIGIIMRAADEEPVMDAVEAAFADTPHMLSGAVKDMRALRESITGEIPVVMLICCVIVLGVLWFMSRSWLEPFIFLIVIGVSILLNMGTNWLFDSISFVTFAVAAILQLALAMDYSIMLINAYDRLCDAGLPPAQAMTEALTGAFMPISSSALTTVAGMLSLVFMSFTIGFDIGMVLAKGIVISMLTVFLFMPGLLTLCAPLLRRTAHKQVRLGGRHLPRVASGTRGVVPLLLIGLIIVCAVLQTGNVYTFTMQGTDEDSQRISDMFGQDTQVALLFPAGDTDADYDRQRALLQRIGQIEANGRPVLRDAYAMVTTGAQALEYHDAASAAALLGMNEASAAATLRVLGVEGGARADELLRKAASAASALRLFVPQDRFAELYTLLEQLDMADATFNGENLARAILSLDISLEDPQAARVVRELKEAMSAEYGHEGYVAGMMIAMDDIATSFTGDMLRVSLITIIAVFLIVLLSFRTALIPLVLVCVIQGAIWVNMAVSGLMDGTVFFMCYLICVALQMGATIDYGILLTSNYRVCRCGMDKRAAIARAMDMSLQTILTSGIALIVAGFTVGAVSSVVYIASIGTMLGRGAVISVAFVLLLLPQLLLWLDRWIVKTPAQDSAKPAPARAEGGA